MAYSIVPTHDWAQIDSAALHEWKRHKGEFFVNKRERTEFTDAVKQLPTHFAVGSVVGRRRANRYVILNPISPLQKLTPYVYVLLYCVYVLKYTNNNIQTLTKNVTSPDESNTVVKPCESVASSMFFSPSQTQVSVRVAQCLSPPQKWSKCLKKFSC